jgi:hypothetical protein
MRVSRWVNSPDLAQRFEANSDGWPPGSRVALAGQSHGLIKSLPMSATFISLACHRHHRARHIDCAAQPSTSAGGLPPPNCYICCGGSRLAKPRVTLDNSPLARPNCYKSNQRCNSSSGRHADQPSPAAARPPAAPSGKGRRLVSRQAGEQPNTSERDENPTDLVDLADRVEFIRAAAVKAGLSRDSINKVASVLWDTVRKAGKISGEFEYDLHNVSHPPSAKDLGYHSAQQRQRWEICAALPDIACIACSPRVAQVCSHYSRSVKNMMFLSLSDSSARFAFSVS